MTVCSKLAYGIVVSVSSAVAAYAIYNIISKIQSAKVEDDRLQNSCSESVSNSHSPVFAQSSQKCVDEDGKGSKNQ
ncbi:hypothetical protein WR25_15625 [Diploscapter pachys]|uniref:Uncharacterized protein n=1 Tax=Diploscapter pachys TaxID=2018661 RepID=A0A2A2M0S6_9BILA|nr:hypothetical protein WR25_15625 [Diploscapter pachys]